jgi:hypothetical protein
MAGVIVYSLSLTRGLTSDPEEPAFMDLMSLSNADDRLDQQIDQGNEYRRLIQKLSGALGDATLSLREATDQLASVERAHDPQWLAYLQQAFPGCSDRECLGANLVTHALVGLRNQPDVAALRRDQLAREFLLTFGRELPVIHTAPGSALPTAGRVRNERLTTE